MCRRCAGNLYPDEDGVPACIQCGWRDYRSSAISAIAEEREREAASAAWADEGFSSTRVAKREARRRNR